jgi:septum site-determining protein MinD
MNMAETIVFASGKGGCGVSSVVVGLAFKFAQEGKKILLIDANAGYRTLDKILGLSKDIIFDISDVINGNCSLGDALYTSSLNKNITLIPATNDPTNIISALLMKRLLKPLKGYFDYILIDSPSDFGDGFFSAASCADRAVIVTQSDPISVFAAKKINYELTSMGINDIRLIINRFLSQLFVKAEYFKDLDDIIDITETQLIGIIPEDSYFASILHSGNIEDLSKQVRACVEISNISKRIQGEDIPFSTN